jgi:3-dehydroquinate synthase
MPQLPSLSISDNHETRFLLFDPLETLWDQAVHLEAGSTGAGNSRTVTEPSGQIVLVVDGHVLASHRGRIDAAFPGAADRCFEVPPGEGSKSVAMWSRILDFAFSGPLKRNTPLVAIGGGVTGDLAGFAAASLMRGLPLYHVPTTLLAMVDSAVGGKTGINHRFGKNTIGAFYHPRAVLFDTAFLDTLPQREWLCGISEVLKYGYIADPELLEKGAALADPHTRTPEMLQDVIERSVRIKSGIVASDAREQGRRAWLNFGHTFGHALETLDNYRNINHGEAVYAGMIAALFVARHLGHDVTDEPLLKLKTKYSLNLDPYTSHAAELVTLMAHDKKNRDRDIRLVLVEGLGRPVVTGISDPALLHDAWHYTFETLS